MALFVDLFPKSNEKRKTELNKQLPKRQKLKVKGAGQNVKISHKWTTVITICGFVISVGFSAITSDAENMGVSIALIMLLCIVLVGIVFDAVGVAVSTASEPPFHAMAAKKIGGAKESIFIIRHAQQISSVCNDVIGDIASIISGAMTAAIVINMAKLGFGSENMLNLLFAGAVAAVMIGGKAAGKGIALIHNNTIVFVIGRMMSFLKCLVPNKKKTGNTP